MNIVKERSTGKECFKYASQSVCKKTLKITFHVIKTTFHVARGFQQCFMLKYN